MNTENFEILGKLVTVETDNCGSFLRVTFDGIIIEDSSGDCVEWPCMVHIHGAARASAERKILLQAATDSICNHIHQQSKD